MTEQEAIQASKKHWEENKAIVLADVKYKKATEWPIYAPDCALCEFVIAKVKMNTMDTWDYCTLCPFRCFPEWGNVLRLVESFTNGVAISQTEWESACQALIDKLDLLLE